MDHFGGTDNGRTHAPVPFYVSSAGYGVLIDAARYITVYAGTAVRRDSPHPPQVRDRNTDRQWSSQPTADAVEVRVPAAGATVRRVPPGPRMGIRPGGVNRGEAGACEAGPPSTRPDHFRPAPESDEIPAHSHVVC